MKPCKRIELVIEQSQSSLIDKLLKINQIDAYTIIPNVSGRGERGYRRGNELTDATANCIFIIAIQNETRLKDFLAGVRPLLTRFGGACILSDGYFLTH